ncbi:MULTISPECIES: chaplin [unclassified Streptomyces]|uniref:chaplin n=1 Tax=unclassified Streptomyces TaxID=2593676 RepID=UPI002E27B1F9|nr:chaplin [Streptomyces sp. NBC_01429]
MRDLISKGLLTAAAASSVLSLSGGSAQAADAEAAVAGSPGVASGNSLQLPLDIPVNVCGNTVNPIGLLNPAFGNACANTSSTPKAHHTEHGPGGGYGSGGGYETGGGYGSEAEAGPQAGPGHSGGGYGSHDEGASSTALVTGSPGVLSGGGVQVPVDIPVNACGNSVDLVGILNPVFGNECVNGTPTAPPERPDAPETPDTPDEVPEETTPPEDRSVVPPAAPPHHVPHTENTPRPVTPAVLPAARPAAESRLAATGGDPHLLAAAASSAGLILGGALLYRRSRVAARR